MTKYKARKINVREVINFIKNKGKTREFAYVVVI